MPLWTMQIKGRCIIPSLMGYKYLKKNKQTDGG